MLKWYEELTKRNNPTPKEKEKVKNKYYDDEDEEEYVREEGGEYVQDDTV